ncbi:hypothetical protein PGTUg99_014637 [Puccinia graminis f. sp. tritici]|uniref:Uncharacterized protein n=1 Tax=Puccinia graminis f. sp. tritici TaxID=56615 RepID=A0A5B0LJU1_PUCGR|nr:hypothetical protein PGTUg99_014637 [Puccinia graminis f. sp. tritici]
MRVLLSFQLDHWALFQGVLRVLQGLTSVQQQLVMSLSSEMSAGWGEIGQWKLLQEVLVQNRSLIVPDRSNKTTTPMAYILVDHNGWEEEV